MTRLTSKGIYRVKIQNNPHTIIPPESKIWEEVGTNEGQWRWIYNEENNWKQSHIDLYQNFRITANQKSTMDTQTNKKYQFKYNTKDSP